MESNAYALIALEYLLVHEGDDFEEQCLDAGLTLEEGLSKDSGLSNHVYYCAYHGYQELIDAT